MSIQTSRQSIWAVNNSSPSIPVALLAAFSLWCRAGKVQKQGSSGVEDWGNYSLDSQATVTTDQGVTFPYVEILVSTANAKLGQGCFFYKTQKSIDNMVFLFLWHMDFVIAKMSGKYFFTWARAERDLLQFCTQVTDMLLSFCPTWAEGKPPGPLNLQPGDQLYYSPTTFQYWGYECCASYAPWQRKRISMLFPLRESIKSPCNTGRIWFMKKIYIH